MSKTERINSYSESTLDNSFALLSWQWRHRAEMTTAQQLGMGQSVVFLLAAYVERELSDVVNDRIYTVANSLKVHEDYGKFGSIQEILDAAMAIVRKDMDRDSQYNTLKGLYKMLFAKDFSQVVGDAFEDVEVIFSLRNSIAHGRDLSRNVAAKGGFAPPTEKPLITAQVEKIHHALRRVGLDVDNIGVAPYLMLPFEAKALHYFRSKALEAVERLHESAKSAQALRWQLRTPFPSLPD